MKIRFKSSLPMSARIKTFIACIIICGYSSIAQAQMQIVGPQTGDTPPLPTGITPDAVAYTSIAFSPSNAPYIAFVDDANGKKTSVMRYSNGMWEHVGTPGFSEGEVDNTSIAIAPDGTPYVFFRDLRPENLNRGIVMTYDGFGWVRVGDQETIFNPDVATNQINSLDIVTDPTTGTPYIAFRVMDGSARASIMKYDPNAGEWKFIGSTSWHSKGDAGSRHNIVFSNDGQLYWAGRDWTRARMHQYNGDISWSQVGSGNTTGGALGMVGAVSPDGVPYVLYRMDTRGGDPQATVLKFSGTGDIGGWEVVGSFGFSEQYIDFYSIVIDPSGVPVVAYKDGASTKIMMRRYNSETSTWDHLRLTAEDAVSQGAGNYVDMGLDNRGVPYLVFSDAGIGGKAVVLEYPDEIQPSVVVSSASTNPTSDFPIPVNITFSEKVEGLTLSHITVENGKAINLNGSGKDYTVDIVPASEGLVSVNIAADVVQDLSGNSNTAASEALSIEFLDPEYATTVIISTNTGDSTALNPVPVKIDFFRDVTGFELSEVMVTGGTASDFSGNGKHYTVNVTPDGNGVITMNVAAAVAEDPAGNDNAAAEEFSITYDETAPSASVASTATSPTAESPIPVDVAFSEPVKGFVAEDIVVGNGAVINFSGSGAAYTFTVIPNANGAVTIDIPAGVSQDPAGNSNQAATTFNIDFNDPNPPAVYITSKATDPTDIVPIMVDIRFSRAVTGFDLSDMDVTLGTAANLSGSGGLYTVEITPTAYGDVLVDIPAGAAVDAGNAGNSEASQFSIFYCVTPFVKGQPADVAICPGEDATFKVNAGGTGISYQWQVDDGTGFKDITDNTLYNGAQTPTLNLVRVTPAMGGYQYQVLITGSCDPAVTSSSAELIMNQLPYIVEQPVAAITCPGADASFTVETTGTDLTYQWQVDDLSGTGFVNLAEGGVYSGVTAATLNITGATVDMQGYVYRAMVSGCSPAVTSEGAILTLNEKPVIVTQPTAPAMNCPFTELTTFDVMATGTELTYQWQVDNGTGLGFVNLKDTLAYAGTTTANLSIADTLIAMDGFQYRVEIVGTCGAPVISDTLQLMVYPVLNGGKIGGDQEVCPNTVPTPFINIASPGGESGEYNYQWQMSYNGVDWTDIEFANEPVYALGSMSRSTYFRRMVTSGGACGPGYSNTVFVKIAGDLNPGMISGEQEIAYGDRPDPVFSSEEASGEYEINYQWEMSVDEGETFTPVENAIAKDFNPPGSLYETTTYRRIAISAIGCGTALSNWVTIVVNKPIFSSEEIPNVLFPNGSVENRTWGVSHMGLEGPVKIRVFARNGQIIFTANNPESEWDGTHNGKLVPKGNYFFSIENQEGKGVNGAIKVIY